MNALHSACFQNTVIRGSIWDPTWGDEHTHPNSPLFGEMEWYLTCRQVAHAGDVFNTYCQSILAEILEADSTIWPTFPPKLFGKNLSDTIEKLKRQGKSDSSVREALRDLIKALWCNEVEIIAVLRNKIVHQAGIDPERKFSEVIVNYPPGQMQIPPVSLDPKEFPFAIAPDGKLIIDAKTGYWASQHVQHLIHLMDQTLCSRFSLERSLRPIRRQTFRTSAESTTRALLPGIALPCKVSRPAAPPVRQQPKATFIPYDPMPDQKENTCAQTWHRVFREIDGFVIETCAKVGVSIRSQSAEIAGKLRALTLNGHDRNLSYTLFSEEQGETLNELGIRLRQHNFEPYITIWSSKTQMIDYRPCELSEDVKEHLVGSIQQTISG